MRLIDTDELARTLDPRDLVEALRKGHQSGRMGGVERLLLEDPRGDDNAALTWAGWDENRGIAVKTATVFPGNGAAGSLPNVQSLVVLFRAEDGAPLAALHGESFTRMKTAADSALAADLLARREVDKLAVLGAGGQAETHIRFLLAIRPSIRRISVWNRSSQSALRLVAGLAIEGVEVSCAANAEAAVRGADLVTCLTAAGTPILRGEWLQAGSHVDLVGGYTPTMRESDDDVIRRGRLFADSLRFGVTTCGDYAVPIESGLIGPQDIKGDLFGLCSGQVQGRLAAGDITVCKNGGGGHLDLMAARALYEAALSRPH